MKITQYLSELLFQRDSVILPGFGEFRTTDKPAEKTPSGKIMPPAKHISFNSSIKANDYVLAKYISEKEELSILKGNEKITEFVDQILASLEKDRKLFLPALGSFLYDENKILVFEPDYDINYKTDSFGLTPTPDDLPDKPVKPVSSKENKKPEKPEKPEKPKKAAKPDKDKEQEKAEEPAATKIEVEAEKTPFPMPPPAEKSERKRRRWLVWLIIILLILIAAVVMAYLNQDLVKSYYTNLTEQIFSGRDMPEEPAEPVDEPLGLDAITGEQADETDSLAVADDHITGQEPSGTEMESAPTTGEDKTPAIAGSKGSFAIIAGCFGEKANAERMAARLRSEDFPNAGIEGQTSTGLYRVAAETFNSESDAKAALVKAHRENKLSSAAWITKL